MFFGLPLFRNVLIVTATVVAATAAMWLVRHKTVVIKVIVGIFSVPLGLLGVSLLCLIVLSQLMGCDVHGIPRYSPNGKIAARIETSSEGALGGDTFVTIYAAHGFTTKTIFAGDWRSVEDRDIQWLDDSHLVIHYVPYRERDVRNSCEDTRNVHVTCVPDATR